MRHLIRTLVVVVIVAALFVAWHQRPPSSFGSRSNILLSPGGTAPAFFYGAFRFDDGPYTIVYFARISSTANLATPTPWLEKGDRRIFIEGRRILPRDDMIQMYVADGSAKPQLVLLAPENSRELLEFIHAPQNVESGARFWNDFVHPHLASK